jgi:hypothetical protein
MGGSSSGGAGTRRDVDVRCSSCGYVGSSPTAAFVLYRNEADGFSLATASCVLCGEATADRDPSVVARLLDAGVCIERLHRPDRCD